MCSRHYLNQINYKIVNIVKICSILSSSAIKVYQNNCYVSDWLEVSIETKLFGQLFQIPSFPLHSSDISYKPYLSMQYLQFCNLFVWDNVCCTCSSMKTFCLQHINKKNKTETGLTSQQLTPPWSSYSMTWIQLMS